MIADQIDRIEGIISKKNILQFKDTIDNIVDELVKDGFEEIDVATYLTEVIREYLVG
jgi:hypothetical protein